MSINNYHNYPITYLNKNINKKQIYKMIFLKKFPMFALNQCSLHCFKNWTKPVGPISSIEKTDAVWSN